MTKTIDCYFDFSSPYGYLGAELIDAVAARHGCTVAWHPVLLGVIFRTTGMAPLSQVPIKGVYSVHDFARSARFLGLTYRQPGVFPIASQNAARGVLWLQATDPGRVRDYILACYRAYFNDDIDISQPDKLLPVVATLGIDPAAFTAAVNDPAIKEALKRANDAAMARGVFGSPFFFVGDEPFWGVDRLPQLERWLESGGF